MPAPIFARRPIATAAAAALLALTPACSSMIASAEREFSDPQSAEIATGGRIAADVVITGVDYAFDGIPASVPAGSRVGFTNASNGEAHELVVFGVAADDPRPANDLWEDLSVNAEPVLVTVAGPGQDGQLYVGDGTITEPGRYLAVCFLPVGANPDTIFEQDGPPESDAPPHAANGMVAEIVVVA